MLDFLRNIGPTEVIIIGLILVIFFGAKRISGLGKTAGEATKEFKHIKNEFNEAVKETKEEYKENGEGKEV